VYYIRELRCSDLLRSGKW